MPKRGRSGEKPLLKFGFGCTRSHLKSWDLVYVMEFEKIAISSRLSLHFYGSPLGSQSVSCNLRPTSTAHLNHL
jgi:hypothetical protein